MPMTTSAGTSRQVTTAPDWVERLAEPNTTAAPIDAGGCSGTVRHGTRFTHVDVRIHNARQMCDYELQRSVHGAYLWIHRALQSGIARHPVRFWNFIPAINECVDGGIDRYMVFNAGRYAAYLKIHGDELRFGRCIATSTAVGHPGDDLCIRCLADSEPGQAFENPRQISAYRYTSRYGPMPPCFARMTMIASPHHPGRRSLLVGGTASVVGERTVHADDLDAQIRETFKNITLLLCRSGPVSPDGLRDVRVYYVHPEDRMFIAEQLHRWLPHLRDRVDMVCTNLCRRDLQIEIEGVAEVG
jgi:enamine deaminase RidA (YjgF/YER057c/UK114 family)